LQPGYFKRSVTGIIPAWPVRPITAGSLT
jgi:hypothetical protein